MTEKKLNYTTIDYHTYKNRLLEVYPESTIDIQLVYHSDKFSFKKESGKVVYSHEILEPFAKDKKIIGGYCVIKNKLGEFLEIMNDPEIQKCKQVARMKNIWNTWESEMYLKTIIKRACKRFFYDIVKDIEDEDNKNYDLSLINNNSEKEQNTPLSFFKKLIEKNPLKDKLIEEWEMTGGDIELQKALFRRVKNTGQ